MSLLDDYEIMQRILRLGAIEQLRAMIRDNPTSVERNTAHPIHLGDLKELLAELSDAYRLVHNCLTVLPESNFKKEAETWLASGLGETKS